METRGLVATNLAKNNTAIELDARLRRGASIIGVCLFVELVLLLLMPLLLILLILVLILVLVLMLVLVSLLCINLVGHD